MEAVIAGDRRRAGEGREGGRERGLAEAMLPGRGGSAHNSRRYGFAPRGLASASLSLPPHRAPNAQMDAGLG